MPAVPYLKLAAVHDEVAESLTLFALNRSLDETISLVATARGFSGLTVAQAQALHDDDLDAANTKDEPDRIKPSLIDDVVVESDRLRATLPPPLERHPAHTCRGRHPFWPWKRHA